jgi:hypothetical protein
MLLIYSNAMDELILMTKICDTHDKNISDKVMDKKY